MLLSILLAGCAAPRAMNDGLPPPETPEQIVARYNANALRLRRVWGTANTFVRFHDPDSGKMRREVGDGHFIFIRPDRVALTTGKLGNVILWAGNNDRRFWLFDLQDDGVAYVGSYAALHAPGTQPLPLPVRPDRWPSLIGLIPIDGELAHVEWHHGDLLVEPRGDARRVLLDADTGLAKRIDLLDSSGRSVILCELTGTKPVRHAEPGNLSARLPAEARVRVVGEEGDLTIKLANLTDDPDKFREAMFDFDAIARQYKPARIVNLDDQTADAP